MRSVPPRVIWFALGALGVSLGAPLESRGQPENDSSAPDTDIEEILVIGVESETGEDFAAGDSVTGFGAEDLAALGAADIADLAAFTPNLEIVTSGATTPTFFIRGVGLNDFNPNSTGAVAIYQDDVAINAPAIQLGTLFDVEGVNILRGPQGTGQARNASAGAIKVYSVKPTGEFGGYFKTELGNFGYQDYEGAVESPIVEDLLAGRVAFRLSQRNGTMHNRCAGAMPLGQRVPFDPNLGSAIDSRWSQCGEPVLPAEISDVPFGLERRVNDIDNWSARGNFLFQPTLDMTWLLNLHGSRRDELTRLGQAIGVGGVFCTRPGVACIPPFPGIPPALRDRSAQSSGLLGGPVDAASATEGYIPSEIRLRRSRLAPCLEAGGCAGLPLDERFEVNAAKIRLAEGLAENLDAKPWTGDFNLTGPTTNDNYGGFLTGELVLPAGFEVKSTTAYDTYDRFIDSDTDFSPATLFHITTDDESWQFYQDLTVNGDFGPDSPLRWEVGAWLLREELTAQVNNDFGTLQAVGVLRRDFSQRSWSTGAYASFWLDFLEDFTLDGGVRFNWDRKVFKMRILAVGSQPTGDCDLIAGFANELACGLEETWQAPTGTIRLTYRFRHDTHVFWKYTRGWKPGSFNATASALSGPTVADPEKIDAFETGIEGSWFDGRFEMNASVFYYSYDDYQIFTAQQFLGGNPEFVILNANDAEVYGSEVEGNLRPWEGAFAQVRFSWLEGQFLDFVQVDQFLGQTGADLIVFRERQNSGNSLLNSPRFKVSLTAEQSFSLGKYGSLVARYDAVWQATTYFDASEGVGLGDSDGNSFLPRDTIAQVPYWLHNVRGAWRSPGGTFEIAGWVRNLGNEAYKTFAFDASSFRATTVYFVGDPRTYGLSLLIQF